MRERSPWGEALRAKATAPAQVIALNWAGHRAALTYTFDDSNSSQLEHFEALSALGVPFSFYLWTEKAESKSPLWARAVSEGHELGNHTHTHQKSGSELGRDTDRATEFIQDHFGTPVWTMAAPYGSTDYRAVAESRFLINRGVKDALILPLDDSDRFDLSCFVPDQGASSEVYHLKVEAARTSGGWQVFLVHGFTGGTDLAYQPARLAEFVDAVQYAKSLKDVWIGTLADVGAYWLGQKAFAAARKKKRGNVWTYSWELPSHFPPGKNLLVQSPWPLSQHGQPLSALAEHRYQVSLDARSLTVTLD